MREYYILQQEELMILASLFELDRIFGLQYENEQAEALVPYRVHEMARNGVFSMQGETLFVREPYKTIMQSMKQAGTILTAEIFENNPRYLWFYVGIPIVCLEESRTDASSVKISLMEQEDLFQILEDGGFLPDECLDGELAALEDLGEVQRDLEQLPLLVRFQVRLAEPSREEETKELCIVASNHNYWVSGHDGENRMLFPYEKERLYKTLWSMMEDMK